MKQKLWITLITSLAYCIDKQLYDAIEYLKEQVRVLVEQQQKQNKRIRLTPQQRIRIAAKARRLSLDLLRKTTVLYTPVTVIGWYNKLIAQKYNGVTNRKKVGRPQISHEVVALVIRLKQENPRWGYQKITDQIVYLGFKISPSTVKNILLENGYDPEPFDNVGKTLVIFLRDPEEWFKAARLGEGRVSLPMEKFEEYIHLRNEARARKDWAEADRIRQLLDEAGVALYDRAGGTVWKPK